MLNKKKCAVLHSPFFRTAFIEPPQTAHAAGGRDLKKMNNNDIRHIRNRTSTFLFRSHAGAARSYEISAKRAEGNCTNSNTQASRERDLHGILRYRRDFLKNTLSYLLHVYNVVMQIRVDNKRNCGAGVDLGMIT